MLAKLFLEKRFKFWKFLRIYTRTCMAQKLNQNYECIGAKCKIIIFHSTYLSLIMQLRFQLAPVKYEGKLVRILLEFALDSVL